MTTTCDSQVTVKKFVELIFPVPWGIIAAKGWGDPCLPPVLVVHGIQDNAGSFDRIMPFLPDLFYYVCIDLPGHGKSSRYPKGVILDFMAYLGSIRRVVLQLGWSKYYYIGHSLGGQFGTYYTALYPEEVTKLVMLDALSPATVTQEDYLRQCKKKIQELVVLENKLLNSEPPNYTREEAVTRLVKGRRTPITREGAEVLVTRSLKRNNKNFYYFSTDQRLKFGVHPCITIDMHLNVIQNIQCPVLLVITKVFHDYAKEPNNMPFHTLKLLRSKNNVEIVEVTGYHDVHNDDPEVVAPHINKFLLKVKSYL